MHRKRVDQADGSAGSASKRIALGTLRLSSLKTKGPTKPAVSRANLISFDDKENSCWVKGTLDLRLTKAQVPIKTEGASISSSILSITERGLGGLPMGRPPDDVEVKREGPGKENDSVVAQRLGSTEIPFDLSQSSSFFSFSAGSPMIVCNTPADCSTTSASFSATNSIPLCTQDGNREHRLDFTVSPEYAKDIYDHLRRQEEKLSANPVYMRKQPDITHGMRAILVDWLVEVAEEYKLHSQTLYLAVSYIDRFLSKMSVLRNKLQLVGTASMLVAAKFEEIHPPEVDEFVYITDDTYTKKQVLKMEYLLLNVLKFDLASPTVVNFLQRYIAVIQANQKTEHLAMYFAELTLLDADPYLKYPPSVIAGAALALALHTLSLPAWTPALIDYSGYTMVNIQACLEDLQSTFIQAPRHPQQAVQEKYSQAKFSSVGRIPPPATLPI